MDNNPLCAEEMLRSSSGANIYEALCPKIILCANYLRIFRPCGFVNFGQRVQSFESKIKLIG